MWPCRWKSHIEDSWNRKTESSLWHWWLHKATDETWAANSWHLSHSFCCLQTHPSILIQDFQDQQGCGEPGFEMTRTKVVQELRSDYPSKKWYLTHHCHVMLHLRAGCINRQQNPRTSHTLSWKLNYSLGHRGRTHKLLKRRFCLPVVIMVPEGNVPSQCLKWTESDGQGVPPFLHNEGLHHAELDTVGAPSHQASRCTFSLKVKPVTQYRHDYRDLGFPCIMEPPYGEGIRWPEGRHF